MAKEKNPAEPVKELSLSGIKSQKKAGIIALFKANKNTWKKASACKAVVFLLAFNKNSDKKKVTIALPCKNEAAMRETYGEIKKSGLLPLKQVAAGKIAFEKDGEGNESLKVEITKGGANLEKLQTFASRLFKLVKLRVNISVGADAELENLPDDGTDEDLEDENDGEQETEDEGEQEVEDQGEQEVEDQGEQEVEDQGEQEVEDENARIADLKTKLMGLAADIKQGLPEMVAKIKSRQAAETDRQAAETLLGRIDALKNEIAAASKIIQTVFQKSLDGLTTGTAGQIKQVLDLLGKVLGTQAEPKDKKQDSELDKLLKQVGKFVDEVSKEVAGSDAALKKLSKEKLKGGKEFLEAL